MCYSNWYYFLLVEPNSCTLNLQFCHFPASVAFTINTADKKQCIGLNNIQWKFRRQKRKLKKLYWRKPTRRRYNIAVLLLETAFPKTNNLWTMTHSVSFSFCPIYKTLNHAAPRRQIAIDHSMTLDQVKSQSHWPLTTEALRASITLIIADFTPGSTMTDIPSMRFL